MKFIAKTVAGLLLFAAAVAIVPAQDPPVKPVDFQYFPQTNNPFPPGMVPGIPILPAEHEKAGILVSIKNCDGCARYTVTVAYYPVSLDPGLILVTPNGMPYVTEVEVKRGEGNPGDRSYAVVWLGNKLGDHRVESVEVAGSAVIARSKQTAK